MRINLGNAGKPRITASAHSCPPVVSRLFKSPGWVRWPAFSLLASLCSGAVLCCPTPASAWEYSEIRNAFGEVVGTGVRSEWVYPLQGQSYPEAQLFVPCSRGRPQVKFNRPHELTNWIEKYHEPTPGDQVIALLEERDACGDSGSDAACIGHGIGTILGDIMSIKPGETRYRLDIRVGNNKGKVNVRTFEKAPNHAFVMSRKFPRYLATGEPVAIAFDWQGFAGGYDPIAYRWESSGFAETFSQFCRKTIKPTDPSKRKRKRIRDEF